MTIEALLLSRLTQTVRRQQLFHPGDTLVVALSGGADSTALLDLLSRLPEYNLRLIATHVNHCLRGSESDNDEQFCRELAASHAVPFELRRIDIKQMAREQRLNLEDAGRRARIDFFDEISAKYGATATVLAHHADDQAETVLMRLLRGSGMTGLSGMAYRNERGYLRPLLDISRAEIEQYLHERRQQWREDASNSDTIYLRNRIRHQLLPLLEEYNPAIRATLAATAAVLGGDEALLAELTEQAYDTSFHPQAESITGSITTLRALNPALLRRVLRHALKQLSGTLEGVSQRHLYALCDIIDSPRPNSRLALPQGVTATREYDRLLLAHTAATVPAAAWQLLITAPGEYQIPGGGSITIASTGATAVTPHPDSAYFNPSITPLPWLLRSFCPGDRMTPFGMSGRKKVKDIFIDRKIPPATRKSTPLLFCGDDLIWLVGICVSEVSRIDEAATKLLQVTLRK